MNVLQQKPVFTLDIHGYNTSYFIRLNGMGVFDEFSDEGQTTLTLPVNQWMHPQDNVLELEILPPEEGAPVNTNANVTLKLQVHPAGNPDDTQTIATLVYEQKHLEEGDSTKNSSPAGRYNPSTGFSASDEGEVVISEVTETPVDQYEGSFIYQREMTIPSSLPLWAFFESDRLPNYYEFDDDDVLAARDELYEEYKKIYDSIIQGEIDSIMPLFEERSQELDAAFYLEPGTTQQKLRASLEDTINDDDLELIPLNVKHFVIILEENRKLVSLARNWEGQSAIRWNYRSFTGSTGYHLIYRRENGKWIITR